MYGYAIDETPEVMPLPIVLARKIALRMDELSKTFKVKLGLMVNAKYQLLVIKTIFKKSDNCYCFSTNQVRNS